jgi:hypothetical protein
MEERLEEVAEPGEPAAGGHAPAALADDCEPMLGPLGTRLLVLGIVVLLLLLVGSTVWLLGMLAYTTPPVPGTG